MKPRMWVLYTGELRRALTPATLVVATGMALLSALTSILPLQFANQAETSLMLLVVQTSGTGLQMILVLLLAGVDLLLSRLKLPQPRHVPEGTEETILSKLPQNESVFWCDGKRLSQTEETNINIQLPPDHITNAIKEHTEQCGLNLVITVH
ncbi:hypothetical protein [Petrachloros mirabilis]